MLLLLPFFCFFSQDIGWGLAEAFAFAFAFTTFGGDF
jgi:hypothetical protein